LEHSLGVAKVVGDIAAAFREASDGDLFSDQVAGELRLAALLHDIGHGIFSHLSESLIEFRWSNDFDEIRKESEIFRGKKAGEILSYLLITSRRFDQFLKSVFVRYNKDFSVERIAGYVVGRVEDSLSSYKADVITGPLDADKLDYIARDSYFTGIRSEVDVGQIVRSLRTKIVVTETGQKVRALVVSLSGSSFVEQMHFARVLLYPAMYHHQKVRALECMIRSMFEIIWGKSDVIAEPKLKFSKITDILRINDTEFLFLCSQERLLGRMAKGILKRNVFKRALHISRSVVQGNPLPEGYEDLRKLDVGDPADYEILKQLRAELLASVPSGARRTRFGDEVNESDVWLDLPTTPTTVKDLGRCYVDMGNEDSILLTELFPIDRWLASYAQNKWTGHVFGFPDDEYLKALNRSAVQLLQERFELGFTPAASQQCKLAHPDL
jgi:hypothetical protein